ncbi:MAG TPA: hypothetical protein VM662_02790 [Sphingomonas sp.]|nr:hypothetical protein [Sphingomonas sp.]
MRILALALCLAAPATLHAQTAPTAAPAAASALSIETPIETIAADPAGKAVLEKLMPTLLTHAAYDSFKSMSLKDLAPYSQGAITDEKLAAVDAALKALRK